MESSQEPTDQKIVRVKAPLQNNEIRRLIISLVIFLGVVALLAFVVGFALGKINLEARSTQTPQSASPSAKVAGWKLFNDSEAQFAISHPEKWEANKNDSSDYAGVKLTSKKGSVSLWLLADQPFLLGEAHQKALESQEDTEATIDSREATGTKYNYKAGNFFIVLVLKGAENTPQVTFWIEADDEKTRDEALKIVESFDFQSN